MVRNRIKIGVVAALCVVVLVPTCFAEAAQSHKECLKKLPGDWGPNFGAEWHKNEAVYWGCRLGVPAETVASWQKAADEMDMAQEISLAKVQGRELVMIEEMGGQRTVST